MEIKYLKHHEIDQTKWDRCIRESLNGNLYGWSWYLDVVSPGWEALVSIDYQSVMPLTFRKKWGFYYLFRPLLNQQLGIFSSTLPNADEVRQFMESIPPHFKLIEITLNKHNTFEGVGFMQLNKTSYELNLHPPYSQLAEQFKQNTRRNIKKALKDKIRIDDNLEAEEFLKLMWKDESKGSAILIKPDNLNILIALMKAFKDNQSGRIIGARQGNGQLVAGSLFGISHQKLYNLVPLSTPEGKESQAQSFIIDQLIRQYSGQEISLDFEGSDIEGVARFYAGFGAKRYTYPYIKRNRLPIWLKFIKS